MTDAFKDCCLLCTRTFQFWQMSNDTLEKPPKKISVESASLSASKKKNIALVSGRQLPCRYLLTSSAIPNWISVCTLYRVLIHKRSALGKARHSWQRVHVCCGNCDICWLSYLENIVMQEDWKRFCCIWESWRPDFYAGSRYTRAYRFHNIICEACWWGSDFRRRALQSIWRQQ